MGPARRLPDGGAQLCSGAIAIGEANGSWSAKASPQEISSCLECAFNGPAQSRAVGVCAARLNGESEYFLLKRENIPIIIFLRVFWRNGHDWSRCGAAAQLLQQLAEEGAYGFCPEAAEPRTLVVVGQRNGISLRRTTAPFAAAVELESLTLAAWQGGSGMRRRLMLTAHGWNAVSESFALGIYEPA